jgi:hypothetical protein
VRPGQGRTDGRGLALVQPGRGGLQAAQLDPRPQQARVGPARPAGVLHEQRQRAGVRVVEVRGDQRGHVEQGRVEHPRHERGHVAGHDVHVLAGLPGLERDLPARPARRIGLDGGVAIPAGADDDPVAGQQCDQLAAAERGSRTSAGGRFRAGRGRGRAGAR